MPKPTHLVRMQLKTPLLMKWAKDRSIPFRHIDEGYLVHQYLTQIFADLAPKPFFVEKKLHRLVGLWGYAETSAEELSAHGAHFGDPLLLDVLDGGSQTIRSKLLPAFPEGQQVGFNVRACPVVRTSGRGGNRKREVDAWLAACLRAGPDVQVDREAVYSQWIHDQVESRGAKIEMLQMKAFQRDRFWRRAQGGNRKGYRIERPDVHFSGILRVTDQEAFAHLLMRGVGRHRSFGFGMLRLVAPGSVAE